MTTSRPSRQTSFVDGSESESEPKRPKRGYQGGPLRPSGLLPTPTVADTRDGTILRTGHNGEIGGRKNVNLNHLIEGLGYEPPEVLLWPTPVASNNRKSSKALYEQSSPPGLEQAIELSQGIIPKEYDRPIDMTPMAQRFAGFSPPATPASRSATPGSGPARMTPGTSGRGFAACLPASAPTVLRGFVSRMSEGTSAWGSTVCSLTWTTSATPQRRGLFLLRASAPSTAGTGCGSSAADPMWPTQASANAANDTGLTCSGDGRSKPNKLGWAVTDRTLWPTPRAGKTTDETEEAWTARQSTGAVSTPPLALAVKMWATPRTEGHDAVRHRGRADSLHSQVKEHDRMWPSPVASEARQGYQDRTRGMKDSQESLSTVAMQADGQKAGGQKLNPLFVSRLMGYPDDWLTLD